jgi:membrane associated rhomboid family serine protease
MKKYAFDLILVRFHPDVIPTRILSWFDPNLILILPDSEEPLCSRLSYNPNRRWEVWRFVTYSLVHANGWHLLRNLIGQLVVGVPLEMSHPTYSVAAVFMSGVVGGALGSIVMTDDETALMGASGILGGTF